MWQEIIGSYTNCEILHKAMYTQMCPFSHHDMYYLPQYVNPDMQMIAFYGQLPFTYQSQYFLPIQQFVPYPIEVMKLDQKLESNPVQQTSKESSQIDQKQEQKRTRKIFSVFKYPKKNVESNIINQIFSFLSLRAKSQPILQKILSKNEEKIKKFYELLKQIKKKNKKYINRFYIKDLATLGQDHIGQKIIREIGLKEQENTLSIEQFKKALRILVSYYLRQKCISTVITSVKLDKQTMKEHLHRKRQVQQYFSTEMQIITDE